MGNTVLIIFPGHMTLFEKAYGGKHPAGLSDVKAKGRSFDDTGTNNPTPASHAERMKLSRMAAQRMLGSSKPETAKKHTDTRTVDRKGREAGEKRPHTNYRSSVSGMGSQAHNNFAVRTYIVRPEDLGSSAPESAREHLPKNVPTPKK